MQAILYGILQGLTEFLPVSSSGHLALAQELFSFETDASARVTFSVFLHFATLFSVAVM